MNSHFNAIDYISVFILRSVCMDYFPDIVPGFAINEMKNTIQNIGRKKNAWESLRRFMYFVILTSFKLLLAF